MLQRFTTRRLACFAWLVLLLALAGAAQAAPPGQDQYPAPQLPTADPLAPAPTAYPAPLPTTATPALIGGPIDGQPETGVISGAPEAVAQTPTSQGVLYLWLGFIATLLIFVASVLGAVMLFTRRIEI